MNYFRIILPGLLSLLLFSHSSWAQITITRGDLEVLFAANQEHYVYEDTTDHVFQVNIGETGGPHVYDFSGFQFSRIDTGITIPVSQIPQLIPRYPGDAIALRFTEDRETNDYEYFTYRFLDNGLFSPGEANISTERERYKHNVPEELVFPYPMTFGYSTSYSVTIFDTTYVGGVPTNIETHSTNVTKDVDGWGTLVLPGFGSFNCLRLKGVDLPPSQAKDFFFLTQEGYLLIIGTNNTEPNSGVITADENLLFVPQSVVGVEYSSEFPQEFALLQNYPNPFNPSTTIRYAIPKSGFVTLRMYNLLGQEIETLVNEKQLTGEYEAQWNPTNLSSGVYLYRLEVGEFVKSKKLVFLK